MTPTLNPSQRRRQLVAYFALAYLISWAIEIPLALSYQGVIAARLPFALHYLASFGPLLAAVIVTVATEGLAGVPRVFRGLIPPTPLSKGGKIPPTPLGKRGKIPPTPLDKGGEMAPAFLGKGGQRGDCSIYVLFAVVAPVGLFGLIVLASALVRGGARPGLAGPAGLLALHRHPAQSGAVAADLRPG